MCFLCEFVASLFVAMNVDSQFECTSHMLGEFAFELFSSSFSFSIEFVCVVWCEFVWCVFALDVKLTLADAAWMAS